MSLKDLSTNGQEHYRGHGIATQRFNFNTSTLPQNILTIWYTRTIKYILDYYSKDSKLNKLVHPLLVILSIPSLHS